MQKIRGCFVRELFRQADAQCKRVPFLLDALFLETSAQALRDERCVLERYARKEHHEFIAAETSDNVHGAGIVPEEFPYPPQDGIAENMPAEVVHELEIIHIDHH